MSVLWRDDFSDRLNTEFLIEFSPGQMVRAELTEISELKKREEYESFSLVFSVPKGVPAEPQIYRLSHENMSDFSIFLSPFAEDENFIKLEAVFDRLS